MLSWKRGLITCIAVTAVVILWNTNVPYTSEVGYTNKMAVTDLMNTINLLKMERNKLSSQLNIARRDMGQYQCEKTKNTTIDKGGWCKAATQNREGLTDQSLIQVLSKFLKDKTVGSFGDGPGLYKRDILKLGQVKLYDAYDGAPYIEETSEGRVNFLDLTIPQYGIPLYDWVVSLEVAEHIPSQYEHIYLDNIFRHAKEGIILSWAVPGQGGVGHINNRPLNYVINVMGKNGFIRDERSSTFLQESATLPWIRTNIHVYRRKGQSFDHTVTSWFL